MTPRRPTLAPRGFEEGHSEIGRLLSTHGDLLAELRGEIAQLRAELARLCTSIERGRLDGHRPDGPRQLVASSATLAVTRHPLQGASHPEPVGAHSSPMDPASYARLITRIRSLARTVVPFNAVVAVVSRGDEALVNLDGRIAWHFPRLDDGRWLGHHPRDSKDAIAHLERLRRQGARYLLFPSTALWWLAHYADFARHLESTAMPLARQDDACRIFALQPQESR